MTRLSKKLVGVAAAAAVLSAVSLWRWWHLTAATFSMCIQPVVPAGALCNYSTALFIGLGAGLVTFVALLGAVLAGVMRRRAAAPVV